jgi:hypothetical protein
MEGAAMFGKAISIVLVAFAAWTGAAQAYDGYPAIPPELGIHSPAGYGWVPYRCADWPVANFYHNAWYAHQAPAVYGNYVYRPFYRYTAWRVLPRTYYCVQ